MRQITKAIIPVAGLGTRFLPLTKALPKELLPLTDEPLINFAVREAKYSEIDKIIFILSENKKIIYDYFKRNQKLENILKKDNQKKKHLENLKKIEKEFEKLVFSSSFQKVPKGDGDAVLRAKNQIKNEGFAVLFPDDVFESKVTALSQLKKIFQTSQRPIIGLKKVSKEKISSYGSVAVEKIANRLYKIKKIKEKAPSDEVLSDLVIAGRYILTPEIFNYLKRTQPDKKGEIILADALNLIIKDGKIVYGYEIDGEWLECGNIIDWMKSNLYLCLKHPQYGAILKEFLKRIRT